MEARLADLDTRIRLQGDVVLVRRPHYPDRLFTLRRLLGEGLDQLRMVHRRKGLKSVDWLLTQAHVDALEPAPKEVEARWVIDLQ